MTRSQENTLHIAHRKTTLQSPYWLSVFTLSLLLVVQMECQTASTVSEDQDGSAKLHRQTDQLFKEWDTTVSPGCSLSVSRDGNILYERGYGMADLDHNVPIAPDTVFHVASVSKEFTAAAIMLLVIDGKLSLDDDVHKYLPQLPDFHTKITIEQLVHHTSGIRDQWELL